MLDMAERIVQNRLTEMHSRIKLLFTSAAIYTGRFCSRSSMPRYLLNAVLRVEYLTCEQQSGVLPPECEKTFFASMVNKLSLEKVHTSLQKTLALDYRLILVTGNASVVGDGEVTPEKQILSVLSEAGFRCRKAR